MPIADLLTKNCSWRRRINIDENDYGEILYSDISFSAPCSRQVGPGMNMRQLVEDLPPGDFDKKIVKYWFEPTDIQEGDLVTFEGSETEKVLDVRDAAGREHHIEVLTDAIEEVGEEDFRLT